MARVLQTLGDFVISAEEGYHGPTEYEEPRSGAEYLVYETGDFVLRTGGVERGRIKVDGTTTGIFAATGGGAVSSVFGRTGDVVAVSGDYTAAEVGAVASASLDAIAAAHPAAADWSNNSHKITSVADPTSAQDVATKHYVDNSSGGSGLADLTKDFSQPGVLATGTGTLRWLCPWTAVTINGAVACVGTAPTGASIICDVKKNGTTIYTTSGNRPTIAAGANATTSMAAPDVTALANGDYLTIDIDQVGSTVAGADLVVEIVLTRTA